MSVSAHLKIQIDEYDARIRTFVPGYEQMISVAAGSLRLLNIQSPKVVDLGIGTGALAEHCLSIRHDAAIVGIDTDPAMLDMAKERLAASGKVEFVLGDFTELTLPQSDIIVASIALHHIRTPEAKRAFYSKCRVALKPGGLLVSADCFPAKEERLARLYRNLWLAHLEQNYTASEAEAFLNSWSDEDRYFPLQDELEWIRGAGFSAEVLWREAGFAVILGC